MKRVLILILAIVLFGCTENKSNDANQNALPEKTYKFLVFYSSDYVDTVYVTTDVNIRAYSHDGTNYIGNGGLNGNYLSTTAPIKMLKYE